MLGNAYDQSSLSKLVTASRNRLRRTVDRSTLARGWNDDRLDPVRSRLSMRRRPQDSIGTGSTVVNAFRSATLTAMVGVALTMGREYADSSVVHRWFTAVPEPDTVTIDLSQTTVLGPVIVRLDRTLQTLAAVAPTAVVTAVVSRLRSAGYERSVRAVSLALFPVIVGSLYLSFRSGFLSVPVLLVHTLFAMMATVGLRSTIGFRELCETRLYTVLLLLLGPPKRSNDEPTDSVHASPDSKTDAGVDSDT